MSAVEVKKFVKQSSIEFKKLDGDRVQLTANFVYRKSTYQIKGVINAVTGRAEPFSHQLSLNGKNVFDMRVAINKSFVQSEVIFGKATTGVRRAIFKTQSVNSGALTTGSVDDLEMLPLYIAGCACSERTHERPLLAWRDDGAAKPIELSLISAKAGGEATGLAEVMQTTIALVNNNSFWGELGDCISYGLCLLGCALETLWCLVGTLGTPRPDIFQQICMATSGQCPGLCNFNRTFPS